MIALYLRTLSYLKPIQIVFRVYYSIRNRCIKYKPGNHCNKLLTPLHFKYIYTNSDYININGELITFNLLNISREFKFDDIDWNLGDYGKLWTYNLNYFDFLFTEGLSNHNGVKLISRYAKYDTELKLKDGIEPYPISIRSVNIIKYISSFGLPQAQLNSINHMLFNHGRWLSRNIEYNILANHLLENGIALLFLAYYFKDKSFENKARKILFDELFEQILQDGGHYERSPMYHQKLLIRLLDCIQLIQNNASVFNHTKLLSNLKVKVSFMLAWLSNMSYRNGKFPCFGDSAADQMISLKELIDYSEKTDVVLPQNNLYDSGFRKLESEYWELFINIGEITPPYQPGHSHADIFNYDMCFMGNPIICDTGISTYNNNDIRAFERSTKAHNTVQIENIDQSEMWSAFRVGHRAHVKILTDNHSSIVAQHDGYKKLGIIHKRSFSICDEFIHIEDSIIKNKPNQFQSFSYIHFHPSVALKLVGYTLIVNDCIEIVFKDFLDISIVDYEYALSYNKRLTSACIVGKFHSTSSYMVRYIRR